MSDLKTFIKDGGVKDIPRSFSMLTDRQRTYVDWKALGGIITDDNGTRQLRLGELADMMGISAQSLSQSCNNIPNFWDLVDERRNEFGSTSRLAALHTKWYLMALTMKNWPLSEAYLRNFDKNYKESKSKLEVEAGASLVKLLDKKRTTPIEGEVVDGTIETN